MSLDALRQEIDAVDDKLSAIFVQRMELTTKVGKKKFETGGAILQESRETAILERLSKKYPQWESSLRQVYSMIFQCSRTNQQEFINSSSNFSLKKEIFQAIVHDEFPETAIVSCQGIEGAYSHLAAQRIFHEPNIIFLRNFDAVFRAVEQGLTRFGVLPIENSSHGSVSQVYDLLKRHNCRIVRAFRLPISHCLLSKSQNLSEISEIFSHEQALGQCSNFLDQLDHIKISVCENTAVAARLASEQNGTAAISSEACAAIYNVNVLKRSLQNNSYNETRFICISKKLEIFPFANRCSVLLKLRHQPGSLAILLQLLAELEINLTKLENRPAPGKEFEVLFYLDMECSAEDPKIPILLEKMEEKCEEFLFLGSYRELK